MTSNRQLAFVTETKFHNSSSTGTSQPVTPSPDLSGRQIGDYRVLRRIGRGAMAEVYLAEQTSLSRQVALKVLNDALATDESYVKRFQNEARAAAALVHANIVQIYEVGKLDGVHYIAQEYISGQNLRQLLNRHGPFDPALAVTVMRQVAAALHKAAKKGIVHRDIKPENIMISSAGEVKVADFGLSRIAGEGNVDLTHVGITMGTPLYMSPEQAEGRPLDSRSDLYSFGVSTYHVLAGRPPFEGDTPLAVAVQHVRAQPERLENLRPDLPTGLCRIVHKLLAKEPDERFQDASSLLQELRGLGVDGDDTDWGEAVEDWSTSELIALADARVEATQQLDALMKTSALKQQQRGAPWLLSIILAVGIAFTVGAVAAWTTREPQLLQGTTGETELTVERMSDGQTQYWHAMGLANDQQRTAGFQSVIKYFPEDEYHANLARQQLARIYFQNGDHRRAIEFFEELASAGELDQRLRAIGLAGQIICYEQMGQPQKAAPFVAESLQNKDQLDPQARQALEAAVKRMEMQAAP